VVLKFFEEKETTINEVRFVNFDDTTVSFFKKEFNKRFGGDDKESDEDKDKEKEDKNDNKKNKKEKSNSDTEYELVNDFKKFSVNDNFNSNNYNNNYNSNESTIGKESKLILEQEVKDKKKIQLRVGDLTKEKTDVIVSASNNHLSNSGGRYLIL
jgi:hypothetical protein